jgi:tetratricopeptide (TPR) repeat protein
MFSSQGRGLKLLCKILILLFLTSPAFAYSSKIEVENNAFMHNNKGVTLMQAKKYNSAINEFIIGIKLMPDNPVIHPIYNNLGIAYLEYAKIVKNYNSKKINRYANLAENSFFHAINYYPVNFSYYVNLVEVYDLMGVLDKKAKEYKEKSGLYSPIILALIYKKQGKTLEAQEIIANFKNKNPDLIIVKNIEKYFE